MLGVSRNTVHRVIKREGRSYRQKCGQNSKRHDDATLMAHLSLCLEFPDLSIPDLRGMYFSRHLEEAAKSSTFYRWRSTFLTKLSFVKIPMLSEASRGQRVDCLAG